MLGAHSRVELQIPPSLKLNFRDTEGILHQEGRDDIILNGKVMIGKELGYFFEYGINPRPMCGIVRLWQRTEETSRIIDKDDGVLCRLDRFQFVQQGAFFFLASPTGTKCPSNQNRQEPVIPLAIS